MIPSPSLGPALAALLERHAVGDTGLLCASVNRLWQDRERGHVCLPLAAAAGRDGFPTAAVWRTALLASGVVADASRGDALLPLALDADDRLYLRRDLDGERAIAAFVQARLREPARLRADELRDDLVALGLLSAPGSEVDWQLVAVAAAARSSFATLTGGPGTGKTTTVARWLAVLDRRQPGLRVALCAPTGKARSCSSRAPCLAKKSR